MPIVCRQIVIAALLPAAFLCGCTTPKPKQAERAETRGIAACSGSATVFADIKARVGQRVTVCGYLFARNDDMNIYWSAGGISVPNNACIPIDFAKDDSPQLANARALSGRLVQLDGTMTRLLHGNMLSTSWCRDTGIQVKAIRPL